MAATELTPQEFTGNYPTAGLEVEFTAADNTNGNFWRPSGNDLLIVRGTGTFTINGVPNERNRDGSHSATLTGTEYFAWWANQISGWRDALGIMLTSSANTIEIAIVRMR